jgi:hypothetical protein
MASARRDENGRWEIIREEGDHETYNTWLGRFFNALDPIFSRAKEASEFEFILCLLRIRGMEDGGWDPYETTLRAIPKISDVWRAADAELSKHIGLWIYGHIMEASEPYERLANFIRVASGLRGQVVTAFPPKGNRPPSPGEKIAELHNKAAAAGFIDAMVPLREVWDRVLRNASFHADYSVARSGLRTLNPVREYSWVEYDNLVNGAVAYNDVFSRLYKLYVGGYDRPIEIPVHPDFSPDPDERAIVMVREAYGVIGIKDAWTREQLQRGKIPYHLVRFFPDEAKMLEEDPMRASFPTRPA